MGLIKKALTEEKASVKKVKEENNWSHQIAINSLFLATQK